MASLQKKRTPFTPELRKFAVTLQFYSAKAYSYVRKKFKNVLPHPRTIRKWYEVIDGAPGFTAESFRAIKYKTLQGTVICNLVLDEMSIRKQIQWDGNKYNGFINLGSEYYCKRDDIDNSLVATNALVFLVVALNTHWKIPVAYFLINTLSATERANLLNICLKLLHETGAILHSITFDGAHVNKSMCEKLGASFHPENLKPFIQHPITEEKIYLFFDSCHILKLVRNALAKISILQNEQGQLIKWQYIKQLHEKEKAEGLRAATKLTNKHIDFYNEIMNVRLAAQTLSESVANALIFCESIDTSFTGAVATAEFCTYFNNAFDILNSRNKFSKQPYNKSISSNTLDTLRS